MLLLRERAFLGGRAGTTRTPSLIKGRKMAFPYTLEPVLPSPPALHAPRSPWLSAVQRCTPLPPAAHSRTAAT